MQLLIVLFKSLAFISSIYSIVDINEAFVICILYLVNLYNFCAVLVHLLTACVTIKLFAGET